MPTNVVKTKEDEKNWRKAKSLADKEVDKGTFTPGSDDDYWSYVMSIYKRISDKYPKNKSSKMKIYLV